MPRDSGSHLKPQSLNVPRNLWVTLAHSQESGISLSSIKPGGMSSKHTPWVLAQGRGNLVLASTLRAALTLLWGCAYSYATAGAMDSTLLWGSLDSYSALVCPRLLHYVG